MNNKNIIIAGVVAVGLYLFLHSKKIISMTLAQKAAWHEKVSHTMAQMDTAEKIRAYKAARKEKAAAEGTPEMETRLTPMEWMLAIRAAAEEKAAEEEQGTGFDYIRERNPPTPAVPVEKKTHTTTPSTKKKTTDERTAWIEKHPSPYKYVDEEEDDSVDSGSNVTHEYSQIPEEEIGVPKEINDKKKADDKKKAEEKKKANELWDKIVNDVRGPFLKPIYTLSPSKPKKKATFNKSKIIKAVMKKKQNKINLR